MQPCPGSFGQRRELGERIAGAGADLSCLGNRDDRAITFTQRAFEIGRQHPAQIIGGDRANAFGPQPEVFQTREDRSVRIRADQHADRRCAEQAVALHIPARPAQHFAARGGEADEVGDGCAGHHANRSFAWQAQQIEHPARRHCFDCAGRWGSVHIGGVLPPSRGQPVRSHAGWVRIADHPAKKARRG